MSQLTPYFPLGGGLDLITPAIAKAPGVVIGAVNYEPVASGYSRVEGFERHSGRTAPSAAPYLYVQFDEGESAIAAGQTLTGLTSGATGKVLENATITSGSIGATNAKGYVGLGNVTGIFVDGEELHVGATLKAFVDGDPVVNAGPDDVTDMRWRKLASTAQRALITAVPGSGPVRGVWVYRGNVYAFRNDAGGTAGIMHKATAGGWTTVALGRSLTFTSGGTYEPAEGETVTGATSGATGVIRRVVLRDGGWGAGDAQGSITLQTQTGTFVAENLNIGANLNVMSISGNSTVNALPPGGRYEFINHNFYGSSGFLRMYGCNGVGSAFEFDGANFTPILSRMAVDTPTRIAAHKKHLFLAFPGGVAQFSSLGDPLVFDPIIGAGEIGMGDEITDFIPDNAGLLTILAAGSVGNLYGNDAADFELQTLSSEAGALPWTAEKMGTAIYADNRGVRSMAATQAYGNFSVGTLTEAIQPLLDTYRKAKVQPVASVRVRRKTHYRLFFSNMDGISIYLGKKKPEILPFNLGKLITCICSVEDDDNDEKVFFGSDDGFVYQMESGTSFDGEPIDYFLRLPFNHFRTPQQRKRWHKAVLECKESPQMSISVSADLDYGDPFEGGIDVRDFVINGGGGSWDISAWDQFYWSSSTEGIAEADLDGVSKNISLLMAGSADDEPPHLLQGLTIFYSARGLVR